MNKNAIKKYAVWARRELIERVSQRAFVYGITEEDAGDPNAESVNGHLLSTVEKQQRRALIDRIREKGYQQVVEEVAYTWFNRFAALRFMEVNGYLPSHVRVFTDDTGAFKPQILAEAIHLEMDGLDMAKVYELENANKREELFKYLLIVQCNALNSILPGMFQKIEDYTELLLPDNLLREGSVIHKLITDIPEDNFDVRSENGNGQIEIIGWLYQYYISEKHDAVVDTLRGKSIKKEDIPAATQLFTTDWVVRYLIDNSVGRYWIERHPDSMLADKLTYFVKPKNGEIQYIDENISPQDVTTFDPCVGSGHFLVYAFDVLMEIYKEYGYSEREAAAEIVKKNLYGLDIDGRAVQLAYFAVMMKARQYDRRFLKRGIQPNVYEILESNTADKDAIAAFHANDTALKKDTEALVNTLIDAKEYGSILQMPEVNFEIINARFDQIEHEIGMFNVYLLNDFRALVRPTEIMSRKYAVVATNPPYLSKYTDNLKYFINNKYKDYSGDLFCVFIYRNFGYCIKNGYSGFMTSNVWMFTSSYKKLRSFLINNKSISTCAQLAKGAFFKEASVDVCLFVLKNQKGESGTYIRLEKFKGDMDYQNQKLLEAINGNESYTYFRKMESFLRIEDYPFSYWISERFTFIFETANPLSMIAPPKQGLATADNNTYLRLWFEPLLSKIGFGMDSCKEAKESGLKWFPYNKGGSFRRWYGNRYYVVNWENDGKEIKNFKDENGKVRSRPQNIAFYFKPSITWSDLTSSSFSGRYCEGGFIFDIKGSSGFPPSDRHLYVLGLLNSKISQECISVLNPTITTQVGDMARIPVFFDSLRSFKIEKLVSECVRLSKNDWDSFETSWDFKSHPLLPKPKSDDDIAEMDDYLLEDCFALWQNECEDRFNQLKANEEELNRIFIDIYGLQDELTPEVEDKDVTVRKADLQRDIKSLISYAVGCMFGRYSLDVPGLAYTGGEWEDGKYQTIIPDDDGVLPICDDEYFDDDIVGKFIDFIRVVYGEDTLDQNLKFIGDALGGQGMPREVIRDYFFNKFYKDHCSNYSVKGAGKRPIYWLFDSGKKNGFKCLIYMHRYQPDTIARVRTDYVHEQQSRYRTAIDDLEQRITGASRSERAKLNKQLMKVQAQAEEIRLYEEKIHHMADQMIEIDLDDGVKHNYALFQDVLSKIK